MVHLLKERLARLVALLVVANSSELLDGEVIEARGDLLHVHLVVALYREGSRLRCGSHRPCCGPGRPGCGAHQARGPIGGCSRALLGALCCPLGAER